MSKLTKENFGRGVTVHAKRFKQWDWEVPVEGIIGIVMGWHGEFATVQDANGNNYRCVIEQLTLIGA